MRYSIPDGLVEWWQANLSAGTHVLSGSWRSGDSIEVGRLRADKCAFRADPKWTNAEGIAGKLAEFTDGKHRMGRALGKAFTRAGWQRPRLDPTAVETLMELRDSHKRLEFLLDTNAMVDGIAHWLVEHFADRADLLVTAVSLRELQDLHDAAKFTTTLSPNEKPRDRGKILAARHTYLAANRIRELVSSRTVLWRELGIDDTALLLSRSGADQKSSEADTALLRAVRRCILDRINGLDRYFVTADVALARRATSELPTGSVLASRVREIQPGKVYLPCWWWPGADQGRGIARSAPRLVWELLAMFDHVDLLHESSDRGWTFRAFDQEMWPSDYAAPWVRIEPYKPPRRPAPRPKHGGSTASPPSVVAAVAEPIASPARVATSSLGAGATEPTAIWRSRPADTGTLDANFRLGINSLLDTLAKIATARAEGIKVDLGPVDGGERRRYLAQYLEAAGLATISDDGHTAKVGPKREELAAAWRANDLDGVFDVLRVWAPLDELATMPSPPARPETSAECARALAVRLGQAVRQGSVVLSGGARPEAPAIREAIKRAFARLPRTGPSAMPAYTLLTEVFLEDLGVSPARAIQAWDRIDNAGAFSDVEFRSGGTSSGRLVQEVVKFTPGGWTLVRLDLEAVHGYRDLVLRSSSIA